MAQGKLTMIMPAPSAAAFEAFFNHETRLKWDTLLKSTYVEGGGTHPYKGAITNNHGRGWMSLFTMRTRFLTYKPPHKAAAEMVEPAGPFALWAASMRHRDLEDGTSELIYVFSIRLRPRWLGMLFDPLAALLYRRETRKRFFAMARYLHAMGTQSRIVVFDGICNLCSGGAKWLQHHQGEPPFQLVPMQSDRGRTLLAQQGYDPDDPLTFLVLDGERCLTQSDAWIHLVAAAGGGWRFVQIARVIPRALRDALYRLIARNRYRWFGRRKTCYLAPSSAESILPANPLERGGP